ncbi:hypothetical protein PR202_ga22661 [Eleusine coracana subsp. coracana]|uniref:Uncharacterized protein n=1 Tax=Eleusine coracana subsp. coracana TaxID=191504 RepID=A0AAV5D4I6_ELECO|nr:hypothetical protein PR202_ga22661 [Eleusine coracana subsp. coracana]
MWSPEYPKHVDRRKGNNILLIVGHGVKMRLIQSKYGQSLEPISWHFNEVLRGSLLLSHEFIKLPNQATVQPKDPEWILFEDCLGALDGTNDDVYVPLVDQGWEGSTSDSLDIEKNKKVSRCYVPWDKDMDKVLLDSFMYYDKKEDRCQNGWNSHVYTAAIKNVSEKCGVSIAKRNIESCSKIFDNHYNIINAC